jgi:hypothetical protein
MKRCMILVLAAAVSAQAATRVVTVAGLGGEPDYVQRFAAWAQDIAKVTKSETLVGPDATREHLRAVLAKVAETAVVQDDFVLILIGHGTFDGVDYKFNLPGPDITAAELAQLLSRIKAGRQLVVNTTSASGAGLAALQAENRVLISATKSGTERNATVFARYWLAALQDAAADADKNEVITAKEAFQFAEQKTKAFYETQKRLATEHPQLWEGGPGLAGRFTVLRFGGVEAAFNNPARRALIEKKEDLEQKIDKLKYEKAAMPVTEYKKQLTALLLELAKLQAELDNK